MLEVSDDLMFTCGLWESTEKTSVHYSNENVVNSRVGTKQDKPAVSHYSKPYVNLGAALIGELIFIKSDLAIVNDGILRPKHLNRNFLCRCMI